MSETHDSSRFRWRWWKKREGIKSDTVDRSKNLGQELNVKEAETETAGENAQSILARDMTAMEVHPSGQLGKDRDVATNNKCVVEDTKDASTVQEPSVEKVELAEAIGQPIASDNTPEVRSLGSSDEPASGTKPAKDVPSNMEYAMEATKKGLAILKGVADIVKFPLVKEVIELGISVLDACQTISDVQSGVQRLRNRVTCLLLSVADATKEAEESDRLVKDLENLKQCLAAILRRLKSIASQNAFKSSVLSEPNVKMINECEKDFQDSLERFQILRSLEMGQNIVLIQQQLATFYGVSLDMAGNVEHIKHEVNDLRSDIKSILDGMKASKPVGATVRIPQLTTQLFGRKEVVQRIAEHLSSSDPKHTRICILAPGGMGKTSTAVDVMHHSLTKATFGEDRYWVPCIQANSIENFIAILFKHLKAEKRTGEPLEDIMATLQESDKRRVILLDNFETPWRGISDGESQLKPILADLDSIPHMSILMTMRSEWAPLDTWYCELLDPINSEDSQSLYTSIHPDAHKYPQQLKELSDALGHMPYAITLMASRGKRSGAGPEQLLEEWRAEGTDMLSRRDEGINRCIELSVKSDYVQGSKDAMRILQILSMLPAGVDHEDLRIWAGKWSSQAIETLRDAALIITRRVPCGQNSTTDHHLVLPVVQSYMAQKDRIPLEIREGVLNACYRFLDQNNATAKGPNNPLFKEHIAAIASQEANIQALLTDALKDQHPASSTSSPSNHLDALLVYINYQQWARPRAEIAEQVFSLAQKASAHQQEAAALFCLGEILRSVDKYKDAHQAFGRSHAAFEHIGDDLMALQSQLKQVEVNLEEGAPTIKIESALDAIRSRWETASANNPTLDAWISYYQGYSLWFKSLDEAAVKEAIDVLKRAAEIFDSLGLLYQKADCLRHMARSYARLQDFSAALQQIDLVILIRYSLFGEGFKSPDVVTDLVVRVRYLKGMGRWDDEMETTLAAALEASRELGSSRATLLLLEELGEVYVRKGDLIPARETYEEVIRKGHGLDDNTSRRAVRRSENNLKHIDYLCAKSQGSEVASSVPFSLPARY